MVAAASVEAEVLDSEVEIADNEMVDNEVAVNDIALTAEEQMDIAEQIAATPLDNPTADMSEEEFMAQSRAADPDAGMVQAASVPNAAVTGEVTKYYYFNGQRIGMVEGANGFFRYVHGDHLGSTVAATTWGGGIPVAYRYKYNAFGTTRGGTSLPTDHQYTGQKHDELTGLYYYNARYYDPQIGQFISPDTIVPNPSNVLDYNRYMYVRGNPMRYNDPTGHCATTQEDYRDCIRLGHKVRNLWQYDGSGYFDSILTGGMLDFQNSNFLGSQADAWMLEQIISGYQGNEESIYHAHYKNVVVPYKEQQAARIDEYNKAAASIRERNGAACRIWDCPSIMLDLASLGTSLAQTGSAACASTGVGAAPCGGSAAYFTALDLAISSGAFVYEGGKWVKGGTTGSNLSLKTVEFGRTAGRAAGAIPSATPVVGIFYDGVVLLYDLVVAPFVNTPGGHGTAK